MNIIIFGAGAIGSLFGAYLSKNNDVLLIGRKPHVSAIKKTGLIIEDKTNLKVKINVQESIDDVAFTPDLLILTVKSYDTESAIAQAMKIINKSTAVMSLQNGLDNIDKIKKYINQEQIIAGVTTHGAFFSAPGVIKHTGYGTTILGELTGKKTERIEEIARCFNATGIETKVSTDIASEMWYKAMINSSINPLTAIFQCKNGYLLENPFLEVLVEKICRESIDVANAEGFDFLYDDVNKKTKEVIKATSENYSSMFQSVKKRSETEVDSINGKLVDIGKKHDLDTLLNNTLLYCIKLLN